MKYIVCPRCNRSIELKDGGIDKKVYICQFCKAKIRYRIKSKIVADDATSANKPKRKTQAGDSGAKKSKKSNPSSEADFRRRWPAEYRCEDGHYVRSKNEAIVDNWLYSHGICHAYEKAVYDPESKSMLCSDFYVPELELYIEIWGMKSRGYAARRTEKVEIYRRLGYRLLEIDGDTVKNIDDVLSREFARFSNGRA